MPAKVRLVMKKSCWQTSYVAQLGSYAVGEWVDFSKELTIPEANELIAQLSKAVVEAQK